jgi:hypothetical protein
VEDARQIQVTTPYLRPGSGHRPLAAIGVAHEFQRGLIGLSAGDKDRGTRFTFAKADRQVTTRLVHGYCQRRITARAGRQLPETQPLRMP